MQKATEPDPPAAIEPDEPAETPTEPQPEPKIVTEEPPPGTYSNVKSIII